MVTDAEVEAVAAFALGQDAGRPGCSGPVVVHADGAVECHGCGSAFESFHGEESTWPCGHPLVASIVGALRGSCWRCRSGGQG